MDNAFVHDCSLQPMLMRGNKMLEPLLQASSSPLPRLKMGRCKLSASLAYNWEDLSWSKDFLCTPSRMSFLVPDWWSNRVWTRVSPLTITCPATVLKVACGQALHLGDIVKRRRARYTRQETRKWGAVPRGFAARSRLLSRLASLAQIGELARSLCCTSGGSRSILPFPLHL